MSYDPKAGAGIITDLKDVAAGQYNITADQAPVPATQPVLPPLPVTAAVQPKELVGGADGTPVDCGDVPSGYVGGTPPGMP
jgi:hypothetical protein